MKKKSFVFGVAVVALQLTAAVRAMAESGRYVSESRWLYVHPDPETGKPPSNGYVRITFDLPRSPATNAWVYVFRNGGRDMYVNGKPVNGVPAPELKRYSGHVKGVKLSFAEDLRPGRNVLAFKLVDRDPRFQGLILRGDVHCADGTHVHLSSSAKMSRASGGPVDGWNRADFDDSGWKPGFERGDVLMPQWRFAGPVMHVYMTPEEFAAYRERMCRGFPEARLLSEPDRPDVRIVYRGDTPGVEVNGRIHPPYVMSEVEIGDSRYHADRNEVLAACRRMGMNFLCVKRVGRSTFERSDGGYDFTEFDLNIRAVFARHPDAYIVIYYRNGGNMPTGWERRHPGELAGFAVPSARTAAHDYSATPKVPSFASEFYREDERRFLLAFGAFARSQPWGRRIVGIHCGYGASGDGMPAGCFCLPDTGPRMTEAFRRHLAKKYGDDASLRKAWGDPEVTLSAATVPDRVQRMGTGLFLRDLSDPRDRRLMDYYECYHREFEDFIISFCRSVKEAFPGCLAGAYHGYTSLGYVPEGMTARFTRALASPYVDYMWATVHGNSRMDGLSRHMMSPFHRLGKLSSMEGDDRIYRAYLPGQIVNPGGKPLSSFKSYHTPEESRSTMSKVAANALMNGCGDQMVDFGRGGVKWFNCPEALEPLAAGIAEWRRFFDDPPEKAADVAVVMDPDQQWRQGTVERKRQFFTDQSIHVLTRQTLNFSGMAADVYAPEDFLACGRRYRAVVFLDLFETDAELRAAIRAKVRRPGVTSLWCIAPGVVGPDGYDEAAMEDLTGMSLKVRRDECAWTAVMKDGSRFEPFGESPRYSAPERKKTCRPRVHVDDPSAETLARYSDDGTAAFARKKLEDGSIAMFTGIPVNSPELWADILRKAGCHAFTKPGFYVRRNSRYLLVYSGKGAHAGWANDVLVGRVDQSGSAEVTLERKVSTATDVFTGEVVARDADRFTLKSDVPRTWLLRME